MSIALRNILEYNGRYGMIIFSWIFLVACILSLLYFGIIMVYTKLQASFGGFFLLIGTGSILLSGIYKYLAKNKCKYNPIIEKSTLLILFLGVLIFLVILFTILYYGKSTHEKNADYLVVLGARINGNRITKSLRYRLEAALHYMNENPNSIAIVSGGRGEGENITEAQAMKEYLIRHGIDDKNILMEDRSTDTNENICFSKKIIQDTNKTVIIISNSFHLYRALHIAKKQGFYKVKGIGAPSDRVLVFSYYIREVIAVLKDKIFKNML